jgi:hypothetical protein
VKLHRYLAKVSQLPPSGRAPLCPLCIVLGRKPRPATHMHELWVPPHKGSKYDVEYEAVWTILICENCNLNEADGHRRELMQIQVVRYGRDVMEAARREALAVSDKTKWGVPTIPD